MMARPIKNNCDYFPHDAGMRDHKKVKALRSKFGITGYAVWSMLLEYLTGSDGNVFPYTDLEFELMSGDFGVSATEIRSVVDYCIVLELLFSVNGFVKSESLDERLAPVYEKRGKAKELSKKQLRENGKFAINNTDDTVVTVTETPQSKVKEIKGNKSKAKKTIQPLRALSGIFLLEDVQKSWQDWEQYRKEKKQKLTPSTAKKQMDFLGGRAGPEAIAIINQSILNGWTGLFELKQNGKQGTNGKGKAGITAQGTLDRLNSYS